MSICVAQIREFGNSNKNAKFAHQMAAQIERGKSAGNDFLWRKPNKEGGERSPPVLRSCKSVSLL